MKRLEVIDAGGLSQAWLYDEEALVEEVFFRDADDSDDALAAMGLIPLAEKHPGPIEGVGEEPLYCLA